MREFEFLWETWKKRISGPKTGKRSEKGKDLKKEEKGRREREEEGRKRRQGCGVYESNFSRQELLRKLACKKFSVAPAAGKLQDREVSS